MHVLLGVLVWACRRSADDAGVADHGDVDADADADADADGDTDTGSAVTPTDDCPEPTVVSSPPVGTSSFLTCSNDYECPSWERCLPPDWTQSWPAWDSECLAQCDVGCAAGYECHEVEVDYTTPFDTRSGCYCSTPGKCPEWDPTNLPEFGGVHRWTEDPEGTWPADVRGVAAGDGVVWVVTTSGGVLVGTPDADWRVVGTVPGVAGDTTEPRIAWTAGRLFAGRDTALWSATADGVAEVGAWREEDVPFTPIGEIDADPDLPALAVGRSPVQYGDGLDHWVAADVAADGTLGDWRSLGGSTSDDLGVVAVAARGELYVVGHDPDASAQVLWRLDLTGGEVLGVGDAGAVGPMVRLCDRLVAVASVLQLTSWDADGMGAAAPVTPILELQDLRAAYPVGDVVYVIGGSSSWSARRVVAP